MPHRAKAVLAAVPLVASLASCGLFGEAAKPEDTARAFLSAFAGGDSAAASQLTDRPAEAAALLDKVRGALKPAAVHAELDQVRDSDGGNASASFTATWALGEGREWTYPAKFDLRRTDDKDRPWIVRWSPTLLHPKLSAGQGMAVREQQPLPAPVVDRDGAQLLSPQKVITVLLYREEAGDVPAVAAALAKYLATFDAGITQQSIVDGAARTAPGNGYTVAVLREQDYQAVKDAIYDLPGVRFSAQTRLLAQHREFARQLLQALRSAFETQLTGRGGWKVVTLDQAGAEIETLHETPPAPGTTVVTTLSQPIQIAAERAIDGLGQQAMIVALQPSTGEVLAVAQNPAADDGGALALTGRYPPGSTFKIVTASAAMQAGAVSSASPVPCPGTTVVDGRPIPNNDRFDLGTVELHTAFARSCNTTFARLAADLPPAALPDAARQLGLGVDFELAGVTTITGSVPPGESAVARAEAGFGQGAVVASPFGMALVAATVARGSMPTPLLVRGTATKADSTPPAPPAAVLDPLRAMMREVVTGGTAQALATVPGDVRGKTGTAQFGDGTHSHGWFVGYRADLSFAVLVVDAGSSAPAVQATARFLAAVP